MSIAYHLQLPLAGAVAIDALTALLNREIAGELTVGELDNIGFEQLVAESVVVRDPQGREVIRVARLTAWPDWNALWNGVIRIDSVRARGGEVTLYVSGEHDETVSLVEAFQPAQPRTGPPGNVPRVIVDDIVLDEVMVRGDVPGFAGLRVEDVRVTGRVEGQRDVRFIVTDGRGVMTGPYPGRTHIDRILGYFDTDLANEGLEFYARAHRGSDRVRARIRLVRPDPEAAPIIVLRAQADPLRIETLDEMEVAPGLDALSGTVRGHARLEGPADDLRLRADLAAESGRVYVTGRLPRGGPIELEARTVRLRLGALVPAAPQTTLAGRARIAIDESDPTAPERRLHAELSPLTIGDVAIPGFVLDGMLEDDALVITSVDAAHAGGETHARGRIGFDGSVDVHVRANLPDIGRDPNVRRAAPGARGALVAELNVRAGEGAEDLRAEGELTLRGLRYGDVRASRLRLRGSAGGGLPAPRLDLDGDAADLRIGELALGRAHVSIRGGPEGYAIDAQSRDERAGTRFALEGRATVRDETWRLSTRELTVDLGDGPWSGDLELALTPGRDVTLEPLVLEREGERIVARGTYRFRGDDTIDVELSNVDVEHFRPLAPEALEGIEGIVDGRLELRGDVDRRPQGRLAARIRDGRYGGVSGVQGRLDLELRGETLTTDVELDLGESGRLVAQGPMDVPPAALRDPARLVDEARFDDLALRAENFDVGPLLALLGLSDEMRVAGRITTDAALSGALRRPDVRNAQLVLDRIVLEGWDPLRAKLHVSLEDERLRVRHLWIADSSGELATAEADLPLPLESLPRDVAAFWQLVRSSPWSLSVRIAQRRLDGWPEPLASWVPPGLSASASITARNENGAIIAGVDGVARWVDAATDDRCAAELRPHFNVRGRLENDIATAHVTGFFGGTRPELEADAAAALPFDDWVQRGGVGEFPPTELFARIRGAEMARVPWLCGYGSGPIEGSITAKDLLTGRSVVGAVLDLPQLQIWETAGDRAEARLSTAYRVHVRAGSAPEGDALTVCAVLGMTGREGTPGWMCREASEPAEGELLSRLRVPVRWVPGQLLPVYDEAGTITSRSTFNDVHVEPVLTLIPGIVTGDAVVDGSVRASGPLASLRLEGELDLSEGQVQIEGLGQHLHGIAGRLELRGQEVVFPEDRPLSARDAGGLAVAHGRVRFEGIVPRAVDLRVRADAFPIRREGIVLAWLTGRASIAGRIAEDSTTSEITTRDFVVRLPEQTAATLQPLGPHPEIVVIGGQRPTEAGRAESTYSVIVDVDASDPFWVRRSDFAALVTAQLDATYRDPNLYVGGRADIRRGTFEIFGKRFELQAGSSLVFDETSAELDPQVNITALYEVPGRRGATVTVTVTGTLTSPELDFTSTETNDRAEIIALLVAGGRRETGTAEREASEQAASFLAGLTAGILTLGLRQEFGDVIPVLAIESEGLGGTRVRVGINADDLIPDFLRDVVTGAYIEGFVTATADTATGTTAGPGGIGGGVTLEFTLPRGFLLRGTYVPVDNGSLDLLYEP